MAEDGDERWAEMYSTAIGQNMGILAIGSIRNFIDASTIYEPTSHGLRMVSQDRLAFSLDSSTIVRRDLRRSHIRLVVDVYEDQIIRAPFNTSQATVAQAVLMSANACFMEEDVPHLSLAQCEQIWFVQSRLMCLYQGTITRGRVALRIDVIRKAAKDIFLRVAENAYSQ